MKSILTRMWMTLIEIVFGIVFGYFLSQKAAAVVYMFARSIRRNIF